MAHHTEMVRELTDMAADEGHKMDPVQALGVFLHVGDLSNCVVDWEISKAWKLQVTS